MGNALRVAVIVASARVFSMHANAEGLTLSDIRTRAPDLMGRRNSHSVEDMSRPWLRG